MRARERLVAQGALSPTRALGARGEDLAHRYLQRERGMRIIGRNWRTRTGSAEIDIIAWEGDADNGVLVFVEVKTRSSEEMNRPERQVDVVKRRNMVRGATEYIRRFAPTQERVRFDVVTVVTGTAADSAPEIRYYSDAFQPRTITWDTQIDALDSEPPPRARAAGSGP